MVSSRVGRKPVTIPAGVDVKMQENVLHIKGSKGLSTMEIHPAVLIEIENSLVKVKSNKNAGYCRSGSGLKLNKSIVGTLRAKIANSIQGVHQGFERKLILVGVGYRAQAKGQELSLTMGFSHPVSIAIPQGITVETPTQTEILVKGVDKHLVGHVASLIREVRSPEPYKGKGIRYSDEVIVLKETKKK